jgi:type IV secretion system protein VirD4
MEERNAIGRLSRCLHSRERNTNLAYKDVNRKLPPKGLVALGFFSLIAGLWLNTYWVAYKLNFAPALGSLVDWLPVYIPGQFISWAMKWGKHYPNIFIPAIIASTAFFLIFLFLIRKPKKKDEPPEFGTSAYATLEDAERAGLLTGEGVVLGKMDGHILTHNSEGLLAVAGGSRSGKGRGLNIPTLLNVTDCAIINDSKGEFLKGDKKHKFEGTSGWRSEFSHVVYFNPYDKRSARFNPLMEIYPESEVQDAYAIAIIQSDPTGAIENPDIWLRSIRQFYAGLYLYQLYCLPDHMKNLAGTRDLLGGDLEELGWKMSNTIHRGGEQHRIIKRAAHVLFERSKINPKFMISVVETADSFLSIWDIDDVRFTTGASDWRMSSLMCAENPVSLYLNNPASDEDTLMPLTRLMLRQFLRAHMRHLDRDAQGRPKLHKILALMDEFPSLGKMDFWVKALRRMAGFDIKTLMSMQSTKDFASVYGDKNPFLDIIEVLIAFAANDPDAQRNISSMVGNATEYRQIQNESGEKMSMFLKNTSIVNSEVQRAVLDSGAVRALNPDEELLFIPGFRPFKVEKVKYDQEPVFMERCLPAAPLGDGKGNYPDLPEKWTPHWMGVKNDSCPPMPPKEDPTKPPKDKKVDPIVKEFSKKVRGKKTAEDGLPEPHDWADEPEMVDRVDMDTGEIFEIEKVVFKPKARTNKKAEKQ